jgi:hypothetical protein
VTVNGTQSGMKAQLIKRASTDIAALTTTTAVFTDSATTTDGAYTYEVQGLDNVGNRRTSGNTSRVIKVDTNPPPAVSSLAYSGFTTYTNANFAVTWNGVTDPTVATVVSGTDGYFVYRSTSPGALGSRVAYVTHTGTGRSVTLPFSTSASLGKGSQS